MRTLDPGHVYDLDALDGGEPQRLTFVKREGDGYPGNVGAHGGVIIQEVLRALIARCLYVNQQIPCEETSSALMCLRLALRDLEKRAARRHMRVLSVPAIGIEDQPVHDACGHIGCTGRCGR